MYSELHSVWHMIIDFTLTIITTITASEIPLAYLAVTMGNHFGMVFYGRSSRRLGHEHFEPPNHCPMAVAAQKTLHLYLPFAVQFILPQFSRLVVIVNQIQVNNPLPREVNLPPHCKLEHLPAPVSSLR